MASFLALFFALMFALATCDVGIGLPPGSNPGEGPVARGDAAVTGLVTYRERIALSPGARLVIELRDVSLADAPAPLISSMTIVGPGQVPIHFRLNYDEAEIDPRRTYSVRASIFESDGRMAFTNDTAYEVITHGNPSRVDMRLVMVQPPPGEAGEGTGETAWVEVPARVVSANLIFNGPELLLRVVHHQSAVEGCARRGNQTLDIAGTDVIVDITLMQPPDTPLAIPCDEETVEVDEVLALEKQMLGSKGYSIIVNGQKWASFTPPDPALGLTHLAESLVQDFEIEKPGGDPPTFRLRVVSGRPSGSCTRVNGYEVIRRVPTVVEVKITHHQVSDPKVMCTKDFPIAEMVVPLGFEFDAGTEYTVKVNDQARTFTP